MKTWVQKTIQRIKQFRLVGYIIIGIETHKIKPIEETIPLMFLMVVLTELSVYKKKQKPTIQDIEDELDKIVKRGED